MGSTEHKGQTGRISQATDATADSVKAAADATAAEEIKSVREELTEEEAANIPPSVWEKLQGKMASMLSGPVASTLVDVNKDAAVLAARLRVGRIINDKVRNSMLRNILPESVHPLLLEHKLGAALTDLGFSNLVMALAVMFGDKLPGNMGRYIMVLARCSTTAAYLDGAGTIQFEKLIDQFISKDMMKLLGDAESAGA